MQLSNIPLEILKNAKDDVTLIRDAFRNNTCKDLVTITKEEEEEEEEEEEDVRMNVLACKDAFPVLTIENYFNEDFLDSVKDELLDCEFYQKSNDLYEFVQTEDLNKMMEGTLKTLYSHLCSTEFTEFISALTGIELLESRLNMAGQIYSQGGYLECHDDDIHQSGEDSNSVVGRRIAFIIYLCDERWDSKKQGGELQLLKVNEKDGSASLEVAASLVPKWNRIALFEVTPYSYHRVSEVLSDEHLRVSLTGWFYGPLAEFTSCPEVVVESKQECFEFTQDNKISLEWINKVYRNKKNIKKMQKVFGEESCIELQGFLDGKIHLELLKNIKESECVEKGPANVQSLLEITPNSVLKEFQEKLTSDSFRLWLQDIAYFEPASICFEWKQFRGGDYTLCHDSMEKGECLELVYYFSGTMEPESGGDLVYMSQDEHLLSICPSDNKLVIIYKEEGVMGFVKRLSRQRNTQEDLIMLVCRITIKSEEESSEEGESFSVCCNFFDMDDNSLDSHVLTIVHYLKSKYYKHAQLYADAVMEKHGSDSVISFWKAVSMMLIEGSLQEAVRVLKTLESKRDLLLSCRMALLKANQLMGQSSSGKASQDQNQQGLESVMMDRSDLSEVAWFQAVLFSLIFYSEDETVQLITKGLKAHQGSKEHCVSSMKALLLRIQLKTNDISSLNHEVAKLLEKESSNPWVYYNHVSMVYDVGASEEALKLVNKHTEKKPQTIALLILRLKILASCCQWDSILEASSDLNAAHVELLGDSKVLLNAQPNTTKYHLESILALCMYNLCKQSNISAAEQQVQIIMTMLQDLEPNNAELRIHIVRNLAKMWTKESKNFYSCLKQILDQVTLNGTEPFAAEYLIAKAETYKNQPNALQKAEEVYSTVLKKDPSNADALEGKLLCNLFKGETMNAFEQDINVLLEARRRSGRTGVAHFLQFMDTKDLKYLRAYLKDSVTEISRMQVEFGAYNQLNPSLVCFILNTCLKYNRISFSEYYAPDDLVVLMKDILKDLERFVPGWNDLLLISAKIKILNNDYAGAKSFVHQCIKADSSDIEAFLLQAELLLKAKQPKAAIQVLDSCLSLNFAARNSVKYYFVRAFAYKDCSRFDESLECINTAVLMISSTPQDENQAQKVLSAERRDDMFYILLEKVDLLLLKNDIKAAEATLDVARKAQRSSKTGEPLLIMKQADIELHSSNGKNWRKVLELLETVKYDGPSTFQVFKHAMVKKSKILLKNGNDTKAFLDVYKELYEKFPESADISILYGDALLSVEQVNEATTIFEQVMQKFPEKESELTSKIGRALTKSLKFNKALTFYEKFLSKPEQKSKRSMMFYDYVSLKKKLGHNEAVIELIKVEMKNENSQLLDEGIFRILALILLSDIYSHNGDIDTALVALKKAVSQANVLSQYFGPEVDIAGVPCNRLLSNISVRIAELYHKQGKVEHACKSCNEAISYDIQNYAAHLSLSRLHLEKNDLPSAQNCCASVLKTDPMNEDAVLIHTKILFKQKNFNGAVSHLKPFLDKNPTCFEALWIYIELYNSLGKLTSIQPNKDIENLFIKIERLSGAYLSKEYDAQKIKSTSNENVPSTNQITPGETSVRDSYILPRDTGKAAIHRGYQFCKGIYLKHRRDASEALKCFHYCLNDTNYGELALKHMIDIYLEATNPAAPIPEDSASNSSLQPNSGLLIAQKLLSDNLKGDIHSLLKQSLYHRVLVASRQKNEIERTIPEMQTLVEKQPNFAPGVLALGSAFLALKQNQRAKNVFQSLIKTEWPFEFAQDYEKCFLYLADIQIQYSKFDAAMECFKLCIGYNQACSKAYEGLGFLMEREASYANAAGLYEQAWKHLRENDPALGFKLAYCYLKCKKYVEAIVVCHKILKDYPSYPRLKKEILDKARSLIRQPV